MTGRHRLLCGIAVSVLVIATAWVAWASRKVTDVESQARVYVQLALELGRQATAEVDFYFGPSDLQPAKGLGNASASTLFLRVEALRRDIEEAQQRQPLPRRQRLLAKIRHLQQLISLQSAPSTQSFDEQAQQLYGVHLKPTAQPETTARARLEKLLPGSGPLFARLHAWRKSLVIAPERRVAVFERALQACRQRTLTHWKLPSDEALQVSWSGATPAAWHRYQGHNRSLLQINPGAVAYFPAVLALACHEAYPGHHAQYLQMEAASSPDGIPIEDTVVLLRSKQSVVLEGAAELGVELAFAEDERIAFERDILLPLAGLPVAIAEKQRSISQLESALAANILPVLRDYYDRRVSRDAAIAMLETTALLPDAGPLLDYTRQYGAYVLGYTAVPELLRSKLCASGAGEPAKRWLQLRAIVEHPTEIDIELMPPHGATGGCRAD